MNTAKNNATASPDLLPPTFLFHFAVPCRYRKSAGEVKDLELSEEFVLPSFRELEGRRVFADLRAAWNEEGLDFTLRVAGKAQPPWCRSTRIEDSDGLHVWLDTRDTHGVHRASRFCHRFIFLPLGAGRASQDPVCAMLPIHRARELPKPVDPKTLGVHGQQVHGGYLLQARIPATALTGFEPGEHPRLGFFYAVVDRELGWQTFSLGPEFPIQEDPSLWGTLELVRDETDSS
jgi:hypothetical protein